MPHMNVSPNFKLKKRNKLCILKKTYLLPLLVFINITVSAQTLEWMKIAGNSTLNINASDITIDIEDNIYISGSYNDAFYFDPDVVLPSYGGFDVFTAKIDNSGTTIWVHSFGGNSSEFGKSIA